MLLKSLIVATTLAAPTVTSTAAPAAEAETRLTPETPWAELAHLAGFASAVAIDGDRIFVGDPDEFPFFPMPPAKSGDVQVFSRDASGEWIAEAVLSVPDVGLGEGFATALAAADGWLAVGARGFDEGHGAVFVFREGPEGWQFAGMATLPATMRSTADALGTSVAIHGGWLAAGAPGAAEGQGRVVLYTLDDLATPAIVLGADDFAGVSAGAGAAGTSSDRAFGAALSLRDGTLAIGAPGPGLTELQGGAMPLPGAVFVAALDGAAADGTAAGWAPVARLSAPTPGPALLGSAVLVTAGGEIFAGAPFAGMGGGAIERFVADNSATWSHAGTMRADGDLPAQALLGLTLAQAGDQIIAGAPFASAVVGFAADADGSWSERSRIVNGAPGQGFFGMALAGAGSRLVAGAPGAAIYAGLGHVYEWSTGSNAGAGDWTEVGELAGAAADLMSFAADEPAVCEDGQAEMFGCADVDLVTFVPLSALGAERGVMVNDVWGWTDPETGHEWALVGRTDGMSFVDITNPAAPFYAGELMLTEGATSNIWRDMKVYADHVFIVADAAGQHGMQIFDLTQLRDVEAAQAPIRFSETALYTEIASAHNVVINEDSGFAYIVGGSGGGTTCGGGLHMVDVRDPVNPTFAGCFQEEGTGRSGTGFSHDAQCVNYHGPDENFAGAEICFGSNETALSIADVTDKANPVSLATATYPNTAYLHQGWISDDHRWFFVNDELDELGGLAPKTRTLVWNIERLDDPILVNEHLGTNSASDHNMYVRGNYLYQSNYVSGLRILDVSDPENLEEVGYFDTVSAGPDAPGFAGSWSNYPYFESGKIIVTSMREGLFVVRHRERSTVF
jgi:choice-of-anchor B domain-containing protein